MKNLKKKIKKKGCDRERDLNVRTSEKKREEVEERFICLSVFVV
jgi:hypothetical protein